MAAYQLSQGEGIDREQMGPQYRALGDYYGKVEEEQKEM